MSVSSNLDVERLRGFYTVMQRIRAFERAAETAQRRGLVGGAIHLSIGQEAIAAAVCGNLAPGDLIKTTHRGHGHCIAKGANVPAMMLELFGRDGGACGGKGGSMHIADFSVGMLGANGVVADGIPIAVGAAQGLRLKGDRHIVCCFFGDGAVNRGPFLEGLNWAKIFNLPVLFVCEQNAYASTTRTDDVTAGPGPTARAASLGLEAWDVDGNDVMALDEKVGALVRRLRAGEGPFFLTAQTYRLVGHTAVDPGAYRGEDEVAAAWRNDPIARLHETLRGAGVEEIELERIAEAASSEMAHAVDLAARAPHPPLADAFKDVQDIGAPAPSRAPS